MAAAKALAVIPPLLATAHVAVPRGTAGQPHAGEATQNEPVLACIAMGSNFMVPITLITHLLYSTGPPYFYFCMLMSTGR